MRRFLLFVVATLGACATPIAEQPPAADVTLFSSNRSGMSLPRGWHRWIITRNKVRTRYELVVDPLSQRVVLRADADMAASGLMQELDIDPRERPLIAWSWRVPRLIEGADNSDRNVEDAPARVLLFFDGDKARLPLREQIAFDAAELVTGMRPPYATLMYIWENRAPVGVVIDSSLTGRLKMMVAASGAQQLGAWHTFERDYVTDFERAFGERPGRLIGVGILTDTDNTKARIEAFYGDIRLHAAGG